MANEIQRYQEQVMPGEIKGSKPPSPAAISDETLKAFFTHVFDKADEARRPRKEVWTRAWDLYNGVYDWTNKASWQSKINISKVRGAVDRAAATFRRALVRMKAFYNIESESKLGYQRGLFTKNLLDYWLDRSEFISEFTTSLKVGLITSTIILKVWWDWVAEPDLEVEVRETQVPRTEFGIEVGTESKRTVMPVPKEKIVGKLGIRAVDPFRFWVVPGMVGCIEETEATLGDLEEMAAKGIYSKEAVAKLVAGKTGDKQDERSEAQRKGELEVRPTGYLATVPLYHYWGDITDEHGHILARNATFTIANKDTILRKARPNPFFHGRSPYIVGTPYVVPFSTYNRGIVEDQIGIAKLITEMSNLIADGAMFDAIKSFEVDMDQLYNATEAQTGQYPGKIWRKKGLNMPVDKPLVKAIDVGRIPQEAMAALAYFDREFQAGTAITEYVSGTGAGTRDQTATEVQTKTAQALEGLDDAARTVEETVINKALDVASRTIYQFHEDYTMPRLTENFPQLSFMLRDLTPAERYIVMTGGFDFKARGISVMLDKTQALGKVQQFLEISSHIPGILQRLNVDAVLEEIIMALGWNPQKVLLAPATPTVTSSTGQGPTGVPFPPSEGPTPAQAQAAQAGGELGGSQGNPNALPMGGEGALMQALG